jgi:hypothetical protein
MYASRRLGLIELADGIHKVLDRVVVQHLDALLTYEI